MKYDTISAHQIQWLRSQGVPMSAITDPVPLQYSENLGIFIPDQNVFWNPRTDEIFHAGWAIGELSTGTLSDPIIIRAGVLDWLRANRTGIVVRQWASLFDELYGFDAVSVPAALLEKYNHYIQPRMLPQVTTYE